MQSSCSLYAESTDQNLQITNACFIKSSFCSGLSEQWLEPQQHASVGCICADSCHSGHLWDEAPMALCGHVLLLLLLAHWGPLELFNQLPALVISTISLISALYCANLVSAISNLKHSYPWECVLSQRGNIWDWYLQNIKQRNLFNIDNKK